LNKKKAKRLGFSFFVTASHVWDAQNILENDVLKKNPNYSKAKKLLAECPKDSPAPTPSES
jgi:hypothetical protein